MLKRALLAAKPKPRPPQLRRAAAAASLPPSPNPTTPTTTSLFPSYTSHSSFSPIHPTPLRLFSATRRKTDEASADEIEGEEWMVEWEEEEHAEEPAIGDGGDGGGVVLGDVKWGELALLAARELLRLHLDDDLIVFAFKVSPRGYVYVRLDKLTNKFGCPAIEEIEKFNSLYKQRLDEMVERGEIPLDLAVEVSSPGAERLLKVPEDLDRFKEMPMRVQYMEEDPTSKRRQLKDGIFILEIIDVKAGRCSWKLADVKENRAEAGKGRPLSRKQKDWRISLPFDTIKRVVLYLNN